MKEIQLCNGDPERQLKIEVKKFKDNGRKYPLSATRSFSRSCLSFNDTWI